jgi:hypothetical protein
MKYTGSLPRGREFLLISDNKAEAGTTVETIGIASDSVLVSVFCKSVTGTLQIRVFTEVDVGEDVEIITFPEITTATANLLIRKAALSMDRVRVEAVYSGASEYSVRIRGIGAGETSVRIEGQTSATASKEDIGTTPQIIIPSDMEDRTGLILKNNSTFCIDTGEPSTSVSIPSLTTRPLPPRLTLASKIANPPEYSPMLYSATLYSEVALLVLPK